MVVCEPWKASSDAVFIACLVVYAYLSNVLWLPLPQHYDNEVVLWLTHTTAKVSNSRAVANGIAGYIAIASEFPVVKLHELQIQHKLDIALSHLHIQVFLKL